MSEKRQLWEFMSENLKKVQASYEAHMHMDRILQAAGQQFLGDDLPEGVAKKPQNQRQVNKPTKK